ncbi:MAG: hypothetical protein KGL39_39315 [Patescibacteria group bacterium]|nr:hypothetical protein [Patescibacteria group bacterium]
MKIGKKWVRMSEIYKRFAKEYPEADFSDEAAFAMYRHETFGYPMPKSEKINGFELGKKWMDVTVAGWKEEIPQLGLLVSELQTDGYPDWFLERVGVLHLVPTKADCAWWITAAGILAETSKSPKTVI